MFSFSQTPSLALLEERGHVSVVAQLLLGALVRDCSLQFRALRTSACSGFSSLGCRIEVLGYRVQGLRVQASNSDFRVSSVVSGNNFQFSSEYTLRKHQNYHVYDRSKDTSLQHDRSPPWQYGSVGARR